MPTTYTHFTFGRQCLKSLPNDLQARIRPYVSLFDTGVHGPDIFFYYRLPQPQNKVITFGQGMHDLPARGFFERCREVYRSCEDKDEMLAYIMGFLSHFTLDSTCHGYVDRKKEVTGVTHHEVEAEYDAHLMRKRGLVPSRVDRTASLKPTKRNAQIIARFFDFSETEILETICSQKIILKLLSSRWGIRKNLVRKLLAMLNIKTDIVDLFIDNRENPDCADANLRLDKLRRKALALYPVLSENMMAFLEGDSDLPAYFDHDFEPWPDYQSIPILSLEEERKFKNI